jgi:excisionase family DNA binding protein
MLQRVFANEIAHHIDSDLKLLTPMEAAQILGISKKTVHKLVRDGKLGCVQVTDKERRFTEDQIKAYIKRQSNEPRVVRVDTFGVRAVIIGAEERR